MEITVADAVAIMLWAAFMAAIAAIIVNHWDDMNKEVDKWEDEK